MKKIILNENISFTKVKAFALFCMTISMLLFPFLSFAQNPAIEDTVNALQSVYENTRDFQAGFVQETTIKSIRKTDIEEGTVYYKTPRQMLWDYKKPKAKKLIINAGKAWLYLPQDKTVYTREADQLFKSEALIKFLSGIGKLKDDFDIKYADSGAVDKNGNYLLHLFPREKGAAYSYLQMTVEKKTFHILQIHFDDVMGNSTLVKFSGIKINSGFSSKIFQFQPPPGVSIFKMP